MNLYIGKFEENPVDIPGELEPEIRFVQECLASFPVIVLGSGHSASFGIPGMGGLASHLRNQIPKRTLKEDDITTWQKLDKEIETKTLETALQRIQISQELHDLIVEETWNCTFPKDIEVFNKIICNSAELPLAKLITHLFRSTNYRLSLITTNYDRVAEYIVNYAGFNWATGFEYGYIGERYQSKAYSIVKDNRAQRMVNIWKVHGSLDWFGKDGALRFLPSVLAPPKGFRPAIVTPGIDKYRETHEEPFRSIIAGADNAIESGDSFLCVGYGFNDEHIQPKLIERCKKQNKSIVVITKQLTDSAKKVLIQGKCPRFLAFEESPSGTRMFSQDNPCGVEIAGFRLWMLGELLDIVL
jgi:hypothetical protein